MPACTVAGVTVVLKEEQSAKPCLVGKAPPIALSSYVIELGFDIP